MIFSGFDFSVLDDTEYKEDSVREDIIKPLLDFLGFKPSGHARMIRSKSLKHPYVYFGTTKQKLTVIPDYLLEVNNKYRAVLDAKAPNQEITSGKNVEQAFSYAIHQEIRAFRYALCNGRQISIFDIRKFEPISVIKISELCDHVDEIKALLSPAALKLPPILNYIPDEGLQWHKANLNSIFAEKLFICMYTPFPTIKKISDSDYMAIVPVPDSKNKMKISSYARYIFSKNELDKLLNIGILKDDTKQRIISDLSRAPFSCYIEPSECPILTVECHLGSHMKLNDAEDYVPFLVKDIYLTGPLQGWWKLPEE